ncbi:MAG: uroporphyrinogen-III synthase [Bacteroidales bacterium]
MKVKKILISQPKPAELEKSPYTALSDKYNLEVEYKKFIKVEGIKGAEFRQFKVNILDHSAIIFNSRKAVDHFFRISEEMRLEIPDTMKYFCISEATAYYLQKYVQYRKRKIFHGRQNFNDLMELIKKHKKEKFLLPCSESNSNEIPAMLEKGKIKYSKAFIYRTLSEDLSDIKVNDYDMLVFFSPSGVKSLFDNFTDYSQDGQLIAIFGPSTIKEAEDRGLKVNVKAPNRKAPSMSMAIDQFLDEERKKRRRKKK